MDTNDVTKIAVIHLRELAQCVAAVERTVRGQHPVVEYIRVKFKKDHAVFFFWDVIYDHPWYALLEKFKTK